jgi:hypothetical protein
MKEKKISANQPFPSLTLITRKKTQNRTPEAPNIRKYNIKR